MPAGVVGPTVPHHPFMATSPLHVPDEEEREEGGEEEGLEGVAFRGKGRRRGGATIEELGAAGGRAAREEREHEERQVRGQDERRDSRRTMEGGSCLLYTSDAADDM
eukprot:319243-Rhodomonas_salina.4